MSYSQSLTLVYLTIAALTPAYSQTGTWTSPVPVSFGGQGWEAAAAIDSAGNSVALWDERTTNDQLWSRVHPAAGNWGHAAMVSPALQTTLVFPVVRMSAAGFATAVWTDSNGVWTADRPAGGPWNAPQLLLSGASAPIFVMNARGDAAVAWTVGGPPGFPPGNPSSVMVMQRPAGQAWGSPHTIATGVFVVAENAGISENGDVIVSWESFAATCTVEGCAEFNFRLHTSRNNGAGWAHTGVLLGPDPNSHLGLVALDAGGQALLLALNSSGAYVSANQGATGDTWSPFVTAVFVNGLSMVSGLATDSAGDVTMVYETIGLSTSQAFSIQGSIAGNTWSSPVLLSGSDSVSQIYFAVSPNGEAITAWLSFAGTPEIHVSIRAGSGGAWSVPVTVSAPGPTEISPEAAAISNSGSAIVIYSGYNSSAVHTEYAVNYTP